MRKEINTLTRKVLKAYTEFTQAKNFINDLRLILNQADSKCNVTDELLMKILVMPRFDVMKNEAMQLRSRIKAFCEKENVSIEEALTYLDQLSLKLDETLSLFSEEKILDFFKS